MSLGILELVLLLLAAAILVVVIFRVLKLPALLDYLLVGLLMEPHSIGLMADNEQTRQLAEFGVVFRMFSIGLEFSLPKLMIMRRMVLGGVFAMLSTAILAKMLAERRELNFAHRRRIIGILLFQDLAVAPFLILTIGQRVMRLQFALGARQKSSELFVLNVLFITQGLAWLTGLAGLSLALGAFLAGMLISETQYRYQVEEDIKPFRDVLLGLFFVTVGMRLDWHVVATQWQWVAPLLFAVITGKIALIVGVSRLFGAESGIAMRSGLALAGAGEFGLVLLAQAAQLELLPVGLMQLTLAVLVLSMLISPFLIEHSEQLVRRFSAGEWMSRAITLHNISAQSMGTEGHVIICGFGRSGQNLARFLEQEGVTYFALDLDPLRVHEAAAAGERVVFGDAART